MELYSKLSKKLTLDDNKSHVIHLNNKSTVTCFGHTDQSITDKAVSYYEENYGFSLVIEDKQGKIIYNS